MRPHKFFSYLLALFSLLLFFQSPFFAQSFGTVIEQNSNFTLDQNWQSLTVSDGAIFTFQVEKLDSSSQFFLRVNKVDTNGVFEWSRSIIPADFDADFWFIESIHSLDGGLFLRAFMHNNPIGLSTIQIKLSADGVIENSKRKSLPHINDHFDYLPDSTLVNFYKQDGGLFISTYSQDIEVIAENRFLDSFLPTGADISDSTIVVIDADGFVYNVDFDFQTNWKRSYPLRLGGIKAATDETLIYAGLPQDSVPELNVFKTTSDGDVLWSKQLKFWDLNGDTLFLGEGHFIEEDVNGNIHFFIDEATDSSSVHLVLDSLGNLQASKQIPYSHNEFEWGGDRYYHMGLNWTGNAYETIVHRRMLNDTSECFVDVNFEISNDTIVGEALNDPQETSTLIFEYEPLDFLINSSSPYSYAFCDSVLISSNEEIEIMNGFVVYPNPSEDHIRIQTELELVESCLFNLQGQLILKTNENVIDISQLVPDIYLLKFKTRNDGYFARKVIKL